MDILGLNTLDLLLLLMLFVGMMIGFVRGAVSQIVSMVAIWLGLVATLWLYRPLSERIIQDVLPVGDIGGDTLAFIVLLMVFFAGFNIIIKKLAVPLKKRKRNGEKMSTIPWRKRQKRPLNG